ncbi:hypothetical protein JOF42_000519 [Microbacterium phyllosphaerae]|uniref:Uncharacterized protein n=1 Tax=Microbacterium phyllosphaerae TaxID=124798 RepID=A0ABS4WLE9_9MICO|nr:hypothetical protein [Microbacterium phyllosphaerae]MBP2377024.1 hypothetical protein [Microbacterium phyllosphaerae]
MRTHLGTAIVGIGAAVVVWAITTGLDILQMPWSLISAVAIGLVAALVGSLVIGRGRDGTVTHRTVSGLRGRGDVRVSRVDADVPTGGHVSSETASDISGRNIEISDIRSGTTPENPTTKDPSDPESGQK